MGLISLYRKLKLYRLYEKARDNPELMKDSKFWIEVFKTAWEVEEIRNMLKGWKTYIVAILGATVTLLHGLGYIDEDMFKTLMGLLGAGAFGTVAAKINRIEKETKDRDAAVKEALETKATFDTKNRSSF